MSQAALARLRSEFDADRLARKCFFNIAAPPDTCRYCGGRWLRRTDGMDGHSHCVVSQTFKTRVLEACWRGGLGYIAVARALGVSVSAVRVWCAGVRSEEVRRSAAAARRTRRL